MLLRLGREVSILQTLRRTKSRSRELARNIPGSRSILVKQKLSQQLKAQKPCRVICSLKRRNLFKTKSWSTWINHLWTNSWPKCWVNTWTNSDHLVLVTIKMLSHARSTPPLFKNRKFILVWPRLSLNGLPSGTTNRNLPIWRPRLATKRLSSLWSQGDLNIRNYYSLLHEVAFVVHTGSSLLEPIDWFSVTYMLIERGLTLADALISLLSGFPDCFFLFFVAYYKDNDLSARKRQYANKDS